MTAIDPFRREIEAAIGPIQTITPIAKGFSFEKKFKLTSDRGDFLARLSPIDAYATKAQEFALMQQLYAVGVHCNQPILILQDEASATVCTLYRYLAGVDAEENIGALSVATQYAIGVAAGQDLHRINSLSRATNTWKARKWQKHERYVKRYFQQAYRLKNDEQLLRFIETHYDPTEATQDHLQHDDFHLGNIVLNGEQYGGILDFERYDWGDPLHEFVKLEWFTWPVSAAFARGQVAGYFGKRPLSDAECLQIAVYLAMSLLSTLVWTREFHPHVWPETEKQILSIMARYDNFARIRPPWTA
ncbi:MAG: aminoglycoside phosphotransferase family protein [Caldilinea sp. CFX5]|nr:aminoglycoside phosphotransferase family protein [Caldilinea sp. CFX5]